MKKHILTFVLALVLAPLAIAQTTWGADPAHSNVRFSVKHLGLALIDGEFTSIQGNVVTNTDHSFRDAKFNFTIDVNSINTRVEDRDNHLRSADFFDVEKYPTMTLENATLKQRRKNNFVLSGDLTIRGVTRKVDFKVVQNNGIITDPWGLERAGFTATTKINRRDFGMTYGNLLDNGILDVANEIEITVNLEVTKQ